jgi:hypothetical protein
LRLVESRGRGVRFPHSILQAYLASRVIEPLLLDGKRFLRAALVDPGSELFVALVMYSPGRDAADRDRG